MSADYCSKLQSGAAEVRYKDKLSLCGLETCPYALPADAWVNDPTAWPPLDFPKLFLYLIKTPGRS